MIEEFPEVRKREMPTNNNNMLTREESFSKRSISREERRRKIAELGSERMALITGRIQSLPSSPPTSPSSPASTFFRPRHHQTKSSPSSMSLDLPETPRTPLPLPINDASDAKGSTSETPIPSHESSDREAMAALNNTQRRSSSTNEPANQSATVDREESSKTKAERPKRLFTSKRINSCILASQGTRVSCSLIIAFLVVLSYIDYRLFGRNIVKSESVIASRPLYILLLTDVTIVLAQVFLEKGKDPEEEDEERQFPEDDVHNWGSAVKVLERGLVVYQAFRGVFIDCSIYAVVVICGLSLI